MNRNYTYDVPDELGYYRDVGGSPKLAPESRVKREEADRIVLSASQLESAIQNGAEGDVIWIPEYTTIDASNGSLSDLTPKKGMTIASDRSIFGSPGGSIVAPHEPQPLLDVSKDDVRITGLRIEGPVTEYMEWPGNYDEARVCSGIAVNAVNTEIDNCTIRGWGHAAIEVGRDVYAANLHIHHCDLVDNPHGGLGYGVTVFRGHPLIEYNYFDNNRHAIAGDGAIDCGYIARYNLVGRHTVLHMFDMHEGSESAGKRVSVHHNRFLTDTKRNGEKTEAVRIRGTPSDGAQIVRNRFTHEKPPSPGGESGQAILVDPASSWEEVGLERSMLGSRGDSNWYGVANPEDELGIPTK